MSNYSEDKSQIAFSMIKNYFKIAWQNLLKNKIFSYINIFGLCAGLVSFMLISMCILNKIINDKYQKNEDSVYQLVTEFTDHGIFNTLSVAPAALGEMISKFAINGYRNIDYLFVYYI